MIYKEKVKIGLKDVWKENKVSNKAILEYLEDVDVVYEDGTFEFIQVKYYPKAHPKMKEISTDLYYQYLRFQMLHSTLKAVPKLYIHTNSEMVMHFPSQ